MTGSYAFIVVIVLVALAFDFTNGFHDAANAIATAVSVRALSPRLALLLAAVFNMLGAVTSQGVAKTVTKVIGSPTGNKGLTIVLAALLGAIMWNLITWWKGLPSSSSHALIGGLVGAGVAASGWHTVQWKIVNEKVILPMVFSPLFGLAVGFILMVGLLWLVRRGRPNRLNRVFRGLTAISSCVMSFGHGLQDAQKTMGVIALALVTSGHLDKQADIPLWVILAAGSSISLGTYSGGWRIMRTLGRKVIELDPARAFVAQSTSAGILMATAYGFKAPVSTTHVITSSIMGVGATRKLSAVKWGVAGNIATAWVLTIPCAGLAAAAVYTVLSQLLA